MTPLEIKDTLYGIGIGLAVHFLKENNIAGPKFYRYSDIDRAPEMAARFLRKVQHGALQGTGTGLYCYGCIFVNVPATAMPAQQPCYRNWSYPGYKVDRTALGVVCHEIGHHLDRELQHSKRLTPAHGVAWRQLLQLHPKQVSGYEKVPSEAWAESVRLFILNPRLLQAGCEERYMFIRHAVGLVPTERRSWQRVLLNHPLYVTAAERWITK